MTETDDAVIDEPEDLGVKIGTREEVAWTKVLKDCKILVEQSEENLLINRELVAYAEKRIAEEREKLK